MLENNERFLAAIEEYQRSINSISGDKHLDNHKRSLLFNLIEMMANGVYGTKLNNRDRFTSFIAEFCAWPDGNRVSIQQLILTLENKKNKKLDPLRLHCQQVLKNWGDAQPIPFRQDSLFDEVHPLWPDDLFISGENEKKITLKHFKHYNLLWRVRNNLVHEMRPPGTFIKLFDLKEPHYVPFGRIYVEDSAIKSIKAPWQIFYPVTFYNMLIDNALKSMGDYLESESIDSLKNFNLGDVWIK